APRRVLFNSQGSEWHCRAVPVKPDGCTLPFCAADAAWLFLSRISVARRRWFVIMRAMRLFNIAKGPGFLALKPQDIGFGTIKSFIDAAMARLR
ncbi:MAG TPA: hypothetical protein VIJ06_06990, partial [Methylovirgula sp.]